ncbi:KGG domain-containing protein [Priestia aryabhattai]
MGEKGGEATSKNQGKEFYEEIGKKGGRSNSSQRNN